MKKIIAISVISLSITGCATAFDSGSKNITLMATEGQNIKAEIHSSKGTENITLPTQYSAARSKEDIIVKITDKCFEKTSHVIQPKITTAFYGNILFGLFGVTGTIVDSSNGNMWSYDKSQTVITEKKSNCK